MNKQMLRLIVALAAWAWMAAQGRGEAPAGRPNIVFILLDNCGKEWLGCYGSEEAATPNIDRLAATGLRVEHCYTPVICGPSRIVALTGRYLLRSGMVLHHDAALYSGGGLDPKREVTFARPLRAAGYRTAIAGKWQINHLYDEPGVLTEHGFDEQLVWPGSIDRDKVSAVELARFRRQVEAFDPEFTSRFISHIESRYWDPVLLRNGRRETHPGKFGPDVTQAFVLDFMRRQRDAGKPFLLYYPMVLTHGRSFTQPVTPTPLNMDEGREHAAMYRDMLRYADKLVGDLVAALEAMGLRDNTVVFIATDNGTEKSFAARSNGRVVRGGLYQLSEPGGNVPLIVNCPPLVPGGRTMRLADFSDLLPTFCELAGARPPQDRVIDGRSFAGVILDRPGAKSPRPWIFNQYGTTRVVSDGEFKLYADGRMFDLTQDFEEQTDLGDIADGRIGAARRKLRAALESLPPDAPPPFELRSQSAFRLKQEQRRTQR